MLDIELQSIWSRKKEVGEKAQHAFQAQKAKVTQSRQGRRRVR